MQWRSIARDLGISAASLVVLLLAWSIFVQSTGVKEFLLPSPEKVLATMWAERSTLLAEAGITAWETLLGFALSVAIGIPVALLMTESRLAYLVGNPLIVGLQTVPKIAVAPLLVVWLGFGLSPKVIVVVLVAFFPIVVNAVAGFRSVDADMRNLGRILGLGRMTFFFRISLPHSLPSIFAGLKVAMTLALIGAVVGEFVGSERGLGHLLLSSSARLNSLLSFSALVALTILGLLLYAAVAVAEWLAVPWRRRVDESDVMGGHSG